MVPGARPEGRPCRAVLRSGAARLLGSALYALRVISPGASDGFLCAVGWSEAGFLSLCAAARFGFLLVTESAYVDYNLKAIYSSLAQCGCRGLCESLILARTLVPVRSDADLPKTVGESALRQALSSLES